MIISSSNGTNSVNNDTAKYNKYLLFLPVGLLYFKDLELHTIELNKFSSGASEELSDLVAKIKTSLDIWIAFLTRNDLLKIDNLPKELNDNNLKKALEVLNVMNFSSEERELYDDHLKWLMIEANTLKKAENKAREEGIAIGETRGIEKVAISMLKQKIDDSLIQSVTGFSQDELNKLKNKENVYQTVSNRKE